VYPFAQPVARFALLATLIPLNAFSQTVAGSTFVKLPLSTEASQDGSTTAGTLPSSPRAFWDVDAALTGTFTPIGGDTSVGRGASVSIAVVPATQRGEYAYGIGVVGLFTRAWSDLSTNVSRRERWLLGGIQLDALAELRLSFQVLGGLKSVTFEGPLPPGTALSGTYAAVGVGTTWTVPVTPKVGIRVFDLNWFLTPGDPLSTHRFSLAFGIDVFPLGYFGR